MSLSSFLLARAEDVPGGNNGIDQRAEKLPSTRLSLTLPLSAAAQ
jgi:hypothetical protein